jgi:hypothetical protein
VNQSRSCTTLICLVMSGVGTALAYAMHIVGVVGIGIGTFILAWSFLPQSGSVIEINFQY